MKATEQYFSAVLLKMLYKVVLTFEFVGKSLNFQIKATEQYYSLVRGFNF